MRYSSSHTRDHSEKEKRIQRMNLLWVFQFYCQLPQCSVLYVNNFVHLLILPVVFWTALQPFFFHLWQWRLAIKMWEEQRATLHVDCSLYAKIMWYAEVFCTCAQILDVGSTNTVFFNQNILQSVVWCLLLPACDVAVLKDASVWLWMISSTSGQLLRYAVETELWV